MPRPSRDAAGLSGGRRWHDAFGPLRAMLEREGVTDVVVNSAVGVFVDAGRGLEPDPTWRADEAEVRRLAVALVAAGGRHIDEAHPAVDVRLDAARVHAVLPPVSPAGTLISVRVATDEPPRLEDLARRGTFGDDRRITRWLRALVRDRTNVLVSGGTGAGKTTLLAALLGEANPAERLVSVEDVAELRIEHPHHVGLQTRQANLEGAGEVSLSALVRESLRMRPDRLIVGECRGPEIREMLAALNTGHPGSAGTVHASSLVGVPARLESLGALAGMTPEALARQCESAIGAVLHLDRNSDGRRRLTSVGVFELRGGALAIREVTPWLS